MSSPPPLNPDISRTTVDCRRHPLLHCKKSSGESSYSSATSTSARSAAVIATTTTTPSATTAALSPICETRHKNNTGKSEGGKAGRRSLAATAAAATTAGTTGERGGPKRLLGVRGGGRGGGGRGAAAGRSGVGGVGSSIFEWGGCLPHPDKSTAFFLQALFVWSVLCLPGNIVTFVMYRRVANEASSASSASTVTSSSSVAAAGNGSSWGVTKEQSDSSLLDPVFFVEQQQHQHKSLLDLFDHFCPNLSRRDRHDRGHDDEQSFSLRTVYSRCVVDRRRCREEREFDCVRLVWRELGIDEDEKDEDDEEKEEREEATAVSRCRRWAAAAGSAEETEVMSRSQEILCLLLLEMKEKGSSRNEDVTDPEERRQEENNNSSSSSNSKIIVEAIDEVEEEDEDHLYQCHESFEDYKPFLASCTFWLENVSLLVVGLVGMAGNVMTIVVLGRIDRNTTFNRLLMTLAMVDTLLLLYYVLDYGFVGTFVRSVEGGIEPGWYRLAFPYLLHPLKYFCISASIFMVVAISAERHRAICSPLTHRPAFWPYAFMVLCVAGASNIPKFLEFQLHTSVTVNGSAVIVNDNNDYSNDSNDSEEEREFFTDYSTTPLNEDPAYITFSSWWDELIVTGVIPLAALVLFNARIYTKLRASDKQKYRFVGRRRVNNNTGGSAASTTTVAAAAAAAAAAANEHHQHQVDISGNSTRNSYWRRERDNYSSRLRRGCSSSQKKKEEEEVQSRTTANNAHQISLYSPEAKRDHLNQTRRFRRSFPAAADNDSVCETSMTVCSSDGGGVTPVNLRHHQFHHASPSPGEDSLRQGIGGGSGSGSNRHGRGLGESLSPGSRSNGSSVVVKQQQQQPSPLSPLANGNHLSSSQGRRETEEELRDLFESLKRKRKQKKQKVVATTANGGGGGSGKSRMTLSSTSPCSSSNHDAGGVKGLQLVQLEIPASTSPSTLPAPSSSPAAASFAPHSPSCASACGAISLTGSSNGNVGGGSGSQRSRRPSSSPATATTIAQMQQHSQDGGGGGGGQQASTTSQHFRRRREKSAMILVSIVLTFLLCQTFRLVVQAYEVLHPSHSTPNLYEYCSEKGRFHVPVAFLVMLSASNLSLVVNSSINFLIYCCVGKSFRAELKTIVGSLCRKFY